MEPHSKPRARAWGMNRGRASWARSRTRGSMIRRFHRALLMPSLVVGSLMVNSASSVPVVNLQGAWALNLCVLASLPPYPKSLWYIYNSCASAQHKIYNKTFLVPVCLLNFPVLCCLAMRAGTCVRVHVCKCHTGAHASVCTFVWSPEGKLWCHFLPFTLVFKFLF